MLYDIDKFELVWEKDNFVFGNLLLERKDRFYLILKIDVCFIFGYSNSNMNYY